MYISVPALSADFLKNVSVDVVANFFAIPLERDEELSTGIYIAKPVRFPTVTNCYKLLST